MSDPIIGKGKHRYAFTHSWGRLPRWWQFGDDRYPHPPQTAVHGGVAANGDVYVLSRAFHPVTVFDAQGNFISAWGEGRFSPFVHGLRIAPDGNVWITDSGLHTVTEHKPDGTVVRTMGTSGSPAPTYWGRPFNMPTNIAFDSKGDILVADGYGNRRVHRFAADGELKNSFGEAGSGPGEFAIVHFIEIDERDRIYIADRENQRIQVFDRDFTHLADWTGFDMPSDLAFGKKTVVVGGRDGLSVWSRDMKLLAHFAPDVAGEGSLNIHGVWLDADENIYLAHFDRRVSKLTKV